MFSCVKFMRISEGLPGDMGNSKPPETGNTDAGNSEVYRKGRQLGKEPVSGFFRFESKVFQLAEKPAQPAG
jgi:hypothetical protein